MARNTLPPSVAVGQRLLLAFDAQGRLHEVSTHRTLREAQKAQKAVPDGCPLVLLAKVANSKHGADRDVRQGRKTQRLLQIAPRAAADMVANRALVLGATERGDVGYINCVDSLALARPFLGRLPRDLPLQMIATITHRYVTTASIVSTWSRGPAPSPLPDHRLLVWGSINLDPEALDPDVHGNQWNAANWAAHGGTSFEERGDLRGAEWMLVARPLQADEKGGDTYVLYGLDNGPVGEETWRGSLAEFLDGQELDADDVEDIRGLRVGEYTVFGGGAAPFVALARLG